MLSKEKMREIKEEMLERYKKTVKNDWYAPTGYIFVTNMQMRNEYSKRWCTHTENPNEYSWFLEILLEYREKYGDVQIVDFVSGFNDWNPPRRGSEVSKYNFGDILILDVALYVPIKTWLDVSFE